MIEEKSKSLWQPKANAGGVKDLKLENFMPAKDGQITLERGLT